MKHSNVTRLLPEDFVNALKEIDTYMDISIDDLVNVNERANKYAQQRLRESHLVKEIMSRSVKTVQPDCSLADAAHLLVTHRISSVPVVNDQKQLIGLITEADFLRALGVPTHHPTNSVWHTLENMFSHPVEITGSNDCVGDLMVTDVITATAEQSLHEVLEMMKKNKIKRIVVCDESRHVVGMITRSDLVRIFFDKIKKESTNSPT